MHRVELAQIDVPDFGLPGRMPTVPAHEYQARIHAVWERMQSQGLDVVVVYGDREHSANVTFLTGYDPRFEETLLILRPEHKPVLMIGNEGMGYSQLCPLDIERILYQPFSLLGQAREQSAALKTILLENGIARGTRVGVAGWKYFTRRESDEPDYWLDAPSYIVDTVREISGDRTLVTNCTAMLMHPRDGLRAINSVDQMAVFEAVATYCSQSVRDVVTGVQPGMTEFEAVHLMRLNGIPWSCHLMLSSGPRAFVGLPSPSDRVIEAGDTFTTALGLQGALVARAGYVCHDASELPAAVASYLDVVVKPYYAAAVGWWESLSVGAPAAATFALVDQALQAAGLKLALNPGHLLHLDEWLHSPFFGGSPYRLRSGMVLQCDIIPIAPQPYYTTNVEDGLAIADEAARADFAARHPEAWQRIMMRRQFMKETLGIALHPDVLPFSNWPAVLTPYLLSPKLVMRVAG